MRNRRKGLTVWLVLVLCLAGGCGKKSAAKMQDNRNFSYHGSFICGASEAKNEYAVCEAGLFFLRNHNMQFYDREEKQVYVLCGKLNCRHNDSSCSAWYDQMGDAFGLAPHRGKVYVVIRNREKNTYDFTVMNLSGEERKVIASLDIGSYEEGNWVISGQYGEDIYYSGDMAWMVFQKEYVSDGQNSNIMGTQSIGINLEDGTVTELNEVSLDSERDGLAFEAISENYVILSRENILDPKLSKEEFQRKYQKGEFTDPIFGEVDDPYDYYCNSWYPFSTRKSMDYLCYNVAEQTFKLLETAEMRPLLDENGDINGALSRYLFSGWYQGNIVCEKRLDDDSLIEELFWDMDTGPKDPFLKFEEGGTLIVNNGGNVLECIINGSQLLYCKYLPEERAEIYMYDLETGGNRLLFEDDRQISFRIFGETEDCLWGKVNQGRDLCWILKEDYYNGRLDEVHKVWI